MTLFLPIHLTSKETRQKGQKKSANVQCDKVYFLSDNAQDISKHLQFPSSKQTNCSSSIGSGYTKV